MNTNALLELLAETLDGSSDSFQELSGEIRSVNTFKEAEVLTSNAGLVLRMRDGSEYQLTLVKSR